MKFLGFLAIMGGLLFSSCAPTAPVASTPVAADVAPGKQLIDLVGYISLIRHQSAAPTPVSGKETVETVALDSEVEEEVVEVEEEAADSVEEIEEAAE